MSNANYLFEVEYEYRQLRTSVVSALDEQDAERLVDSWCGTTVHSVRELEPAEYKNWETDDDERIERLKEQIKQNKTKSQSKESSL
jgi:hypothetical protein